MMRCGDASYITTNPAAATKAAASTEDIELLLADLDREEWPQDSNGRAAEWELSS